MRLLDLFCGAGGCSMGYHQAGFEVVGVDINPQPRYPFEFHQADALEFLAAHGHELDAIHASPPCQRYSRITAVHGKQATHPDLIEPTRLLLQRSGSPWIIENVEQSPLLTPILLCGSMFNLGCVCRDGQYRQLRRHRLFETSFPLLTPSCEHRGEPIGVYGNGGGQAKTTRAGGVNRGYMGTQPDRRKAMNIDWMSNAELSQAIPPAYTKFIGERLMAELLERAA